MANQQPPPPPTVLAHKTAFLAAQTLQLSQPLAPSHAWVRTNDAAAGSSSSGSSSHPHLSQKTLDDALFRLNHLLQQHSRRVYAPQASRHVAEQIERLLLDSTERHIAAGQRDDDGDEDGENDSLGDALRVGSDLTNDDMIFSLPQSWSQVNPAQVSAHPPEAKRYEELASSLSSLSARRAQARQRVQRLRRMKSLLQPFNPDHEAAAGSSGTSEAQSGGGNGVQKNLVTRNGELEKELERMRMLLVRVSGRLAQLPPPSQSRPGTAADGDITMTTDGGGGDGDLVVQDLDMVERKKVEMLLDGF